MKRVFIVCALSLLLLAGVVVYRSAAVPQPAYLEIAPVNPGVAVDTGKMAQRLSRAIQIQTVSHQQAAKRQSPEFLRFHAFLRDTYPLLHQTLQRQTINQLSLLYHWQGSDPSLEPILLVAHYDTVPVIAGSESQWAQAPYSGAIEDGYVWGRGTLDDKGTIIAHLETIEQLLYEGFQPARSIYLAYGHDEEIGGQQGAQKISEHLQSRGLRFSLVLDEGSIIAAPGLIPGVDRPVAMLGHAEKGYLTLKLTASDKGGHSSMPPLHTAAGRIAAAVTRLEAQQLPASLEHSADFFTALMPFLPFTQRLLLANRWLFEPLLRWRMQQQPELNAALRTTTAVTMLAASPKENVLPIEASAVVNFRILPGETTATTIAHTQRAVADSSIAINPLGNGLEPSPQASIDGYGYSLLQRSARESWRDNSVVVAPRLVLVTTDTRHYHNVSDQVYRFMPSALEFDDVRGIHGSNERISLENLATMQRFYRRLILNSARPATDMP
jgi:carboxypeptidase PM20D1